ncbi:pilus assembly protein TadG-related protein [Vibrio sinaloensis]|uniref:pilus assembly protein TadG-related protein n=1 Tax=Photobacterium sp. (strain ATCC 43367) TaxID=379097 RepID=UPI00204D5116|nr:pilus assembly protein TadG-related protein [Vibrio sinaloensis]UPQ87486.1 pilus assembly protein TadG-related protein [Vibrio sinaloensis]
MNRMQSGRMLRRQKGLVLVLVTAAMFALIGVAALSIDVNHALMNKSRLQNSADAAALAAAVVIDGDGSTVDATAAANTTVTNIANASGNGELSFPAGSILVQFTNDPQSFPAPPQTQTAGFDADQDTFVRVIISNYQLENYFADWLGIDKALNVSAAAGPSPSAPAVNVVPMAVCQDESATGSKGYDTGKLYALKIADLDQTEMGAGNYQLLDFGSGADTVRTALAGGFEGRVGIGDTVLTKPGNTVGPVGQGLNTRFGNYGGGGLSETDYPTDVYVKEPVKKATLDKDGNLVYDDKSGAGGQAWSYTDYQAAMPCTGDSACRINEGGQYDRRILVIPIVDCSGATGGTNSFTVTALGCFFMLQQAPTSNSGKEAVFGEFLHDCSAYGGTPGQNSDSEGPYLIVLYKDPDRRES